MIKIKRAKCPKRLQKTPQKGTHYNKKDVVEALWKMQKKKCCYCEQIIPKDGHAKAVEHFKPKSVFKSRKNHWPNLLLACAQCNGKKSDKFPIELTDNSGQVKIIYQRMQSKGRSIIIDPSNRNTDPEDHITFCVDDVDDSYGFAYEKNGSTIGRLTIDVIGLTDIHYTKRRRLFYIDTLLPSYKDLLRARENGSALQENVCKQQMQQLLSASTEFAAFSRTFAKEKKLSDRFGIRIPKGSEE